MATTKLNYGKMLNEAFQLEGKLSKCYTAFHDYSFTNQLLAWAQLDTAEPINTYKGWQALGRQVRKGEKAIELCMPVTIKDEEPKDGEEAKTRMVFVFRRFWFGLSQTDGEEYRSDAPASFDAARVLSNLLIPLKPFEMADGNCQGYTDGTSIAINPLAIHPTKTLWHELGHVLLKHVGSMFVDGPKMPRNLKEVEAESVAYLLCNIYQVDEDSKADSRGYIQHWLATEPNSVLPEESAKRIFKAVDTVLKANKEGSE